MAERALDVYLNDHLAGAMLGSELAGHIRDRHAGTPLGETMTSIAEEVEQDRQTLIDLMARLDVTRNPVKQVTGWVAEKASRFKFSGIGSGEPEHGAFMALETLTLGVAGKACLWTALQQIADGHPVLESFELGALTERAQAQHDVLERERLAAARRTLAAES
jgi:hypothetical protein